MKFQLYEMEDISGDKTRIYSPMMEGESITLYEKFVDENASGYLKQVQNIDDRLYTIGCECGLFGEFWYPGEGKMGEDLCCFKDRPASLLRLYFIQFNEPLIILGSGGVKPKNARTLQQVPKLLQENRLLASISLSIQKAIRIGEISIGMDGIFDYPKGYVFNTE